MFGRPLLRSINLVSASGKSMGRIKYQTGVKALINSRALNSTRRDEKVQTKKREELNYQIVKNTPKHCLSESALRGSDVDLRDIQFEVDGQKLSFNLTWLRHSCHCNRCTHQYSRQRLIACKDFNEEMFSIAELDVVDSYEGDQLCWPSMETREGYLRVKWNDGHESAYCLSWLKHINCLYSDPSLESKFTPQRYFRYPKDDFYDTTIENKSEQNYWSASELVPRMIPVDYRALTHNFQFNDETTLINANRVSDMSSERFDALSSLTQQLVRNGLAKIVNVPKERNYVLKVARSLAYERPTGYGTVFNVVVEPKKEINLAYTSDEFDLHSDLAYRESSPGVQLLHCIRNSMKGGLSYFSDAFKAADIMRKTEPHLFEVLTQLPATFMALDPYRNMKFRHQKPLVTVDFSGELKEVYYNPFLYPPMGFKDDVKLFYLAWDKFTKLLHSKENKYIAKMEAGDLFIFHNRRVLHGRSAYDPSDNSRFLQGCYMDWDEINSIQEKLHFSKRP